jgi:Delta24-sterol reductase
VIVQTRLDKRVSGFRRLFPARLTGGIFSSLLRSLALGKPHKADIRYFVPVPQYAANTDALMLLICSLPLSIYRCPVVSTNSIIGPPKEAMEQHASRVAEIAQQVRGFYENKTPFRIYHGSTNSTRPTIRNKSTSVDVSGLTNVVEIDTSSKLAIVEPNVPMDSLVATTLKYDLVPPVIPEFPGITIGGGFAGTAGESSSFKYGFLDATIERIEVVCANGEIITADKTSHEDLFYGMAGTLGTLGVLTLLHVRLVPAKPFVELRYQQVRGFSAAREMIEAVMKPEAGNDFIDGIMYSSSNGVIVTGRFSDPPKPQPVVRFTRRKDLWFYLHAQKRISNTSTTQPAIEYVPLCDYLFRYDRGGFWVGKFAFDYFSLPFSSTLRFLLDRFLHTRSMYHSLHVSGLAERYIIQDVGIPLPVAPEFLESVDHEFGIYPLWLCPLKFGRMGLKHRHINQEQHPVLLNIGIWAPGPEEARERDMANLSLEAKVAEVGGTKWLYAQTYYTENEFWNIYDRESYEALRQKYSATYLPDVYDKVKKPSKASDSTGESAKLKTKVLNFWVFRGLYGVIKAWSGKDYILKKN